MNSIPWHLLFLFVLQILPIIFKFLSTSERKAVKLVCRSWFEVCNLSLSNDEVLNYFGLYQLADIYELLSKSERKFLNLKFDFVNFDDDSSFWENNGSRIRSIVFKDCRFSKGIDKIIVSCENLARLSFIYTSSLPSNGEGRRHYLRLFDNFERVLENGIVPENLNSLKIHIRVNTFIYLSDQTMCQLLTIFPKLKILKIFFPEICQYNFQRLDDLKTDYSDPCKVSKTDFTFAPVINYLITSKDRIEKLKLHFPKSFPKTRLTPDSVRCILDTFTAMNR